MTYQVVNLTYANVPEMIIDDYDELIEYIENENYKAKRDGLLGALLAVRLLSHEEDVIAEKIVQLGYTEYTEALLFDLEPRPLSFFERLKNLFKKPFNKRKSQKTKEGNPPMPLRDPWEYDDEALEDSTPKEPMKELTPSEERARIAATLTKQGTESSTSSEVETVEVDYKKQYQEEQKRQAQEVKSATVSVEKESKKITTEEVPVASTSQKQISADYLPAQKASADVYNVSELSQDNLIKNMAKISEERSLIRQKILENQDIIEQARRAEIENQTLEIEYQTQDQLLHKLQQFHSYFDEFREYLN